MLRFIIFYILLVLRLFLSMAWSFFFFFCVCVCFVASPPSSSSPGALCSRCNWPSKILTGCDCWNSANVALSFLVGFKKKKKKTVGNIFFIIFSIKVVVN